MIRRVLIALGAVLAVVVPRVAQAQDTGFGAKGQISLNSTGSSLSGANGITSLTPFVAFGTTSTTSPDRVTGTTTTSTTSRTTTFALAPGIDVFVVDHLSIGGEVALGRSSFTSESKVTTPGGTSTTSSDSAETFFGLMPRIGYAIPLNKSFSVWPRAQLGFLRSSGDDTTEMRTFAGLDAHFLWHPTASFFLGVGPGFTATLSNSRKVGDVSADQSKPLTFRFLSFTIGGVLN